MRHGTFTSRRRSPDRQSLFPFSLSFFSISLFFSLSFFIYISLPIRLKVRCDQTQRRCEIGGQNCQGRAQDAPNASKTGTHRCAGLDEAMSAANSSISAYAGGQDQGCSQCQLHSCHPHQSDLFFLVYIKRLCLPPVMKARDNFRKFLMWHNEVHEDIA